MNILSSKLVILHHFSKNIESLKKKPCCYDNNYTNTSCSKNIVASSIFEGLLHACISSNNLIPP